MDWAYIFVKLFPKKQRLKEKFIDNLVILWYDMNRRHFSFEVKIKECEIDRYWERNMKENKE